MRAFLIIVFVLSAQSISALPKPGAKSSSCSKKSFPKKIEEVKSDTEFKYYLDYFLKNKEAAALFDAFHIPSKEDTRLFLLSTGKGDSCIVAESGAGTGSGGPLIYLLSTGKRKKSHLIFTHQGFLQTVTSTGVSSFTIDILNRGYSWGAYSSVTKFKNGLITYKQIARAGVPFEILKQLPNIDKKCKESNYDCIQLNGTEYKSLYKKNSSVSLVFVYNEESNPFMFSSPSDWDKGIEIFGVLFLKTGDKYVKAGNILNADTVVCTKNFHNGMPDLLSYHKDYPADKTILFFNGKKYVSNKLRKRTP